MSSNLVKHKRSGSQDSYQIGFTLIELVITLVIMSILATMAIPGFTQTLANQRIKESTAAFVTAFKTAKVESVIQRTSVVVTYDSANKTLSTTKADNTKLNNFHLDSRNVITSTPPVLNFTRNKMATAATIKICSSNDSVKEGTEVTVSPTAVISVKDVACQ